MATVAVRRECMVLGQSSIKKLKVYPQTKSKRENERSHRRGQLMALAVLPLKVSKLVDNEFFILPGPEKGQFFKEQ